MEELLKLVTQLQNKNNREYWLVFYTDGIIEVHDDHKAIICVDSIEDVEIAINEALNR